MLYEGTTANAPGPYGIWLGQPPRELARVRGGFSSWAGKDGSVLGYGHLHISDIIRVAREIARDEVFGVIPNDPKGRIYHEYIASGVVPALVRLELHAQVGLVIQPGEVMLIGAGDKKRSKIDRSSWVARMEKMRKDERRVPPRFVAWCELPLDVQLSEVGRSHVGRLFSLPK